MSDSDIKPAGERGAEEAVAELGRQLLIRLWAMFRTARTHNVNNQAFQRQLQECLTVIVRGMEGQDELTLAVVADYFYLNGVRVRMHSTLLSLYHALMAELERRSIGAIRMHPEIDADELQTFFRLFLEAEDPSVAERLQETIEGAGLRHIHVVDASEIGLVDPDQQFEDTASTGPSSGSSSSSSSSSGPSSAFDQERGRAKRVFWRAVLGTRKILLRAAKTGRPDLRHAKRLVQPVVDNIMNHELSIVGLTALKDHDEYTHAHCVNVSILSMSMGHSLGFSRQVLADLGVAGLVHDVGKTSIPREVLGKPDKLNAEEWALMTGHPIEGVRMLARMPGLSPLALRAMRSCLEHHMNYDLSGYPKIEGEWKQATLSRIIAVADCFDAMTGHRAYQRRPFSSFEALQFSLGPNRPRFDPAVLWALLKTVGLYPPGSVLLTESGHVVLSISPNPKDLRRPHCRVMVHPDGSFAPQDEAVHWDPMPASERVVRVLPPEEHMVSTSELLAA
jgi:HD-GYP domain-containing protein (c-di-GMP phosphodiesterase class II)